MSTPDGQALLHGSCNTGVLYILLSRELKQRVKRLPCSKQKKKKKAWELQVSGFKGSRSGGGGENWGHVVYPLVVDLEGALWRAQLRLITVVLNSDWCWCFPP